MLVEGVLLVRLLERRCGCLGIDIGLLLLLLERIDIR